VTALPVRRSYEIDDGRLRGVVVQVDATSHEPALAVLQAGLHELPPGQQLIHGYDVTAAGLGAWVGDRRVRLRVWPAYLDDDGGIADHHDEPGADVLEIDLDPVADADALDGIIRLGRVFVAGPEMGPTPLVLDVDGELVAEVLASVREA
jgi:hypothetical protein